MNSHAARLLRLQITCIPPLPVIDPSHEFGLQDRQQALLAGAPQLDGELRFRCDATVKPHIQNGTPDFIGPYVYGTRGARFLYLSWRQHGAKDWLQRIKIPLTAITWEQIEYAQLGCVLAARVAGDRSGTVPLLDGGWIAITELED